jgi:hypothetical protein
MPRFQQYLQANVTVLIDGVLATDLANEETAVITLPDDVASTTKTLSGIGAVSIATDQTASVSFAFLPTSTTLDFLYAKRIASTTSLATSFSIQVYSGVGELFSGNRCAVSHYGNITTGTGSMQIRNVTIQMSQFITGILF